MKKFLLSVACSVLFLVGCSHAPVQGLVYSDVQYADLATNNQSGSRMGEACAVSYFGLVAIGDATIETARRNGGVNMITSVDQKYKNYLVYQKSCTVVRGR
ncbi:MAG: hypothetical protein H7222_14740 [Methylotenera sp.]|nr:hypothetical protein [Oligoflexia bacterium]